MKNNSLGGLILAILGVLMAIFLAYMIWGVSVTTIVVGVVVLAIFRLNL